LASEIESLRAEWKARTGSELVISQATSPQVSPGQGPLVADAIIYPSRFMGMLIESNRIIPLPADYAANRELAWSDTFELLQIAETSWAREPHAVSFGSPVLTLYARSDLVEAARKELPRDWHAYHELADLLGRRENLSDLAPPADAPWQGSLQPLAEGWAGRVLLARAAPYVKHRDHFSALFDIETMDPLIDGEGFVRALDELVADYKLGSPAQIEMDPDAVRKAFLAGQSALAISWPAHARESAPSGHVATIFGELPGAGVVFNFADKSWEKRQASESPHVPTLGLAGRLGSITTNSAHPQQALNLLAWLSGREWGVRVASASQSTTLFRRSQLRSPQPWVDTGTDAEAAAAYAGTVQSALSRQQYLAVPRIPGEAEYMAALDVATRQVLRQEKASSDALAEAAVKWREITDRLGRDQQKAAYHASLDFER
jgi:multiple sugar transport system substrate-binding protein